jgi:hypothetical protein
MAEIKNVYRISVWKPKGKRKFGRPRCKCEDNIKSYVQETG